MQEKGKLRRKQVHDVNRNRIEKTLGLHVQLLRLRFMVDKAHLCSLA
jgi:hypothetical protein